MGNFFMGLGFGFLSFVAIATHKDVYYSTVEKAIYHCTSIHGSLKSFDEYDVTCIIGDSEVEVDFDKSVKK